MKKTTVWKTCEDRIVISYFGLCRFIDPEKHVPFSTALWKPKWYSGVVIDPLIPGPLCSHLCRGVEACRIKDPGECGFLKKYYEQLRALDFKAVIQRMLVEAKGRQIIIMVYETPDNKCSEREVIKKWFKDYGLDLQEWMVKEDSSQKG